MIPPPFTLQATLYAWRQLAQRAGISFSQDAGTGFEELGIPVFYGAPEHARLATPGLIISRCADVDWSAILSASENSLPWKPVHEVIPTGGSVPFDNNIPILFWGNGSDAATAPFAELRTDGSVVFHVDLIASAFFMLSRWEETVAPVYDKHERFPALASVAYKQGFLEQPIVDQYALILREWLKVLLPAWIPTPKPFQIAITHDIDYIYEFNGFPAFLKRIAWAVIKKRDMNTFKQAFGDYYLDIFDPIENPNSRAILDLAKASEQRGLLSRFYFMAGEPRSFQSGYDPNTHWLKKHFSRLSSGGHEIGFHAGYSTLGNPELLIAEKQALESALGGNVRGGRHHFLRFCIPGSWRHWEQAGFEYDSTLGYADYEGFRCGTCHPYKVFDFEQNRELSLIEMPLIVMDTTFKSYRGMTPEQGKLQTYNLAQRCRECGGTFTLLWHNTTLNDPLWGRKFYFELLDMLSEMQREG